MSDDDEGYPHIHGSAFPPPDQETLSTATAPDGVFAQLTDMVYQERIIPALTLTFVIECDEDDEDGNPQEPHLHYIPIVMPEMEAVKVAISIIETVRDKAARAAEAAAEMGLVWDEGEFRAE